MESTHFNFGKSLPLVFITVFLSAVGCSRLSNHSNSVDFRENGPSQGNGDSGNRQDETAPAALPGSLGGTGRIPAGSLYGLTLDSIYSVNQIVPSLGQLRKKPTSRIVFDENVPATEYASAVSAIYDVSYVMGEILDSFFVKSYSVGGYVQRTQEFLDTLGSKVDIWEVGNEINGEWVGNASEVINKVAAAYDLVKQKNGVTEMTLYYNEECWSNPANEMFTWADKNVPDRMKNGLDYVLISYYEDDCNNLKPQWEPVFARLAQMFPNSRIGFGEVGTKFSNRKNEYIKRYYSMSINQPHYVGGYFWWYGRQDLVPSTTSYWSVFNAVLGL